MLTTARRRKPTIGPCSAFTRNSAIPRSSAPPAPGCGASADAAPRSPGARGRLRCRAGRGRPPHMARARGRGRAHARATTPLPPPSARGRRGRRRVRRKGVGHGPRLALRRVLARPPAPARRPLQGGGPRRRDGHPSPRLARRGRARGGDDAHHPRRRRRAPRADRGGAERGPGQLGRPERRLRAGRAARLGAGGGVDRLPRARPPRAAHGLAGGGRGAGGLRGPRQAVLPRRGLRGGGVRDRRRAPRSPAAVARRARLRGRGRRPAACRRRVAARGGRAGREPGLCRGGLPPPGPAHARRLERPAAGADARAAPPGGAVRPLPGAARGAGRLVGAARRPRARRDARRVARRVRRRGPRRRQLLAALPHPADRAHEPPRGRGAGVGTAGRPPDGDARDRRRVRPRHGGRPLRPPRLTATLAIVAVSAPATVGGLSRARVTGEQTTPLAVARYVRAHAGPGDTQYVLYARANVDYYTGLPSPYPYAWSLMVRAIPGATRRLVGLLDSPRRPTWVVRWQQPDLWGLDPHGDTRRALHRHYRLAARIGGPALDHPKRARAPPPAG